MGGKKVWELMIEIGHRSTPLTKKLPNGYTHKWTAFVKGTNNSKIEHCVSHVVFQLHESFDNPYRDITEPPFQIRETGYAGFEIPIQIFFKNKEKPNHLAFVHDLNLLTDKPNNQTSIERIKFIDPNREFEKYLIKAGAQLLSAPSKKDRCDSPPAKKQKSSSLIPSKDMSKLDQLSHSQTQSQHHHHHHSSSSHHKSSSSSSSNNNNNNHGSHYHRHDHKSNHHNSNHYHHKDNYHGSSNGNSSKNHQSSKQTSSSKPPKPSNSFVDIFGKPLVYNHNNNNNSASDQTPPPTSRSSRPPSNPPPTNSNPNSISISNPPSNSPPTGARSSRPLSNPPSNSMSNPPSNPPSNSNSYSTPTPSNSQTFNNNNNNNNLSTTSYAILQNRIASLNDNNDKDRLQKIADLVEESNIEFNITSTKFEFDLKRLDKRTLSTIESLIN